MPQDIGGGVVLVERASVNNFIGSVLVVIVVSSIAYVSLMNKQVIDK